MNEPVMNENKVTIGLVHLQAILTSRFAGLGTDHTRHSAEGSPAATCAASAAPTGTNYIYVEIYVYIYIYINYIYVEIYVYIYIYIK